MLNSLFKGAFKAIELNSFVLETRQVSLRELINIEQTPCDLFILRDGLLSRLLEKNSLLLNQTLRDWSESGIPRVFIKITDYQSLIEKQKDNLRTNTRSLSIGDPIEKGKKQAGLLAIHLKYFYDDPTNDELLGTLYQSARAFAHFLMNNVKFHNNIYNDFARQKHFYIYAQPIFSSLFLVGILKQARIFSDKEMESLFVTSFFKDVGMSSIPSEKYLHRELSLKDKKLLMEHARNSVAILTARIPLGPNYFKIIENHHSFSTLTRELEHFSPELDQQLLSGVETIFISITDIISAMISERPYRPATSLFQSLDLIKDLISDQHPQEFKLVVSYFKANFLKGQTN